MCSARDDAALPAPGCPLRESAGPRPFSAPPPRIPAVHALLRLLMPRHPPCALRILTVIKAGLEARPVIPVYVGSCCAVFKVRGEGCATERSWDRSRRPGRGRSLKTRQHAARPRTVAARSGRRSRRRRAWAPAASSRMLPRKEVIQPHLPVRLPCYDFTPVTGPTFDGSFPEGLGHRLRVLPIPVV